MKKWKKRVSRLSELLAAAAAEISSEKISHTCVAFISNNWMTSFNEGDALFKCNKSLKTCEASPATAERRGVTTKDEIPSTRDDDAGGRIQLQPNEQRCVKILRGTTVTDNKGWTDKHAHKTWHADSAALAWAAASSAAICSWEDSMCWTMTCTIAATLFWVTSNLLTVWGP